MTAMRSSGISRLRFSITTDICMSKYPKTSLIGSGTVGSAIISALHKRGYPVASIISRTGAPAKQLAKKVRARRVSTAPEDLAPDTSLLLLGVNDDALESVTAKLVSLKKLKFRNMFIIHFSGVHTSDLLGVLKRKGATVASVHPIQTFPKSAPLGQLVGRLKGCYYGIEGDDNALEKAGKLVNDLGGKAVVVPRELKPVYHTACVFASNYFVVLLNAIGELASAAKLYISWTELFGPMMTATMENTIQKGPVQALTGPVVRNDTTTIGAHLCALEERAPQFLPLYTMCGIEAARIAKASGRLTEDEYGGILKQFKNFLHTQTVRKH